MAGAYKCDICGQLFEARHNLNLRGCRAAWLNLDNDYPDLNNMYYDICPDCIAAIQKVIDERKKEGDNDQY